MIAALVLAAALTAPPRPPSFVTDNAGALSAGAVSSLRDELQSYNAGTGNTVFVYIAQTTGGVPLEDWTNAAATQWKIGRKGKDDGAILFVFMADHKIRIEVGYGLESRLTDARSSEIIRNTIAPKMRAGDVDGAIRGGVDDMLVAISPSYASKIARTEPVSSNDSSAGGSSDRAAIAFIIFIVVLAIVVVLGATRKGRRGGAWYWGTGPYLGGMGGGGFSGFSGGGGGFSGGFGGGFGGGGASGGW